MTNCIKVNDQTLFLAKTGWPCKLGTIPTVVRLHVSDIAKLAPGNWVRIKEGRVERNGIRVVTSKPWDRVLVTKIDPQTNHFFADR